MGPTDDHDAQVSSKAPATGTAKKDRWFRMMAVMWMWTLGAVVFAAVYYTKPIIVRRLIPPPIEFRAVSVTIEPPDIEYRGAPRDENQVENRRSFELSLSRFLRAGIPDGSGADKIRMRRGKTVATFAESKDRGSAVVDLWRTDGSTARVMLSFKRKNRDLEKEISLLDPYPWEFTIEKLEGPTEPDGVARFRPDFPPGRLTSVQASDGYCGFTEEVFPYSESVDKWTFDPGIIRSSESAQFHTSLFRYVFEQFGKRMVDDLGPIKQVYLRSSQQTPADHETVRVTVTGDSGTKAHLYLAYAKADNVSFRFALERYEIEQRSSDEPAEVTEGERE